MKSNVLVLAPGPFSGAAVLQPIIAGFRWLKDALAERRRMARLRAELAALDEHALRDLGVQRDAFDAHRDGTAWGDSIASADTVSHGPAEHGS